MVTDPNADPEWVSSRDVLVELSGEIPAVLAGRARAWRAGEAVVEARFAASVLLIRDRASIQDPPSGPIGSGPPGELAVAGVEAYLLHRHARMPFAPNMVVFPGGRVDPADTDLSTNDGSTTAALRACAVRETAEETGVILAGEQLFDWAHWITPEFEPRRYDTRFFLAALPAGQSASDISGETDRAAWQSPATALEAADRGEIGLLPPTRSLLIELSRFGSVAAAIAAAAHRRVEPVLPRLNATAGDLRFVYPRADESGERP